MQTHFSRQQLADPEIAAAEQIVRKCVHCGFCTATCPTYVLLGDELDGPRGRIYLIKEMLEQGRPPTAAVVQHLDRCLSCLACMTTCPSGVHYQHLIDQARAHVERTYRRPLADRLVRGMLAWTLPYPKRFRWTLRLARLARPFTKLLPRRLSAMLGLAASGSGAPRTARPALPASTRTGSPRGGTEPVRGVAPAGALPAGGPSAGWMHSPPLRRVALLAGCVQPVLDPGINAATERLLRRLGFEVVTLPGCCGSIVHHLGRAEQNRALAAQLIERVHVEHSTRPLDAVVVDASGCGTHLKDYGYLLRNDAELAAKAAVVSALARDVTELLAECEFPAPAIAPGLVVAYHSACSMQHGQQLDAAPRAVLARAGFEVREIPEGHLCCGSAGTYNMLQPEIAGRLRARKLANIERTDADVVATGNIGCITQLRAAADRPIVHTIELVDWATGGPLPRALT